MADGALSANGVTTYFRRAREKTVNWQTGGAMNRYVVIAEAARWGDLIEYLKTF